MSVADSEIGISSCLEALGGDKEHRDRPGVAHEKASTFALLGRDAGRPYPLAHCLDLLGVVEHHRPVAQTHPALRDWRHALSTPDVEAEVVVVAARGDERGCAWHERHELEAEHVAVEAQAALQIADVKVHVANYESRISLAAWLLTGDGGQQAVKIQGMRAAGVLQWPGPQRARAVGGQLDAVAIGVGQVDRLVRAVVGGSLDGGLGLGQPQRRTRQLLAGGIEQRVVVEARVAPCPPRSSLLVEDEQIFFAHPHRCYPILSVMQPQADSVLVEVDRALKAGDTQVDCSKAQRRWQLRRRGGVGGAFVPAHADTPCSSSWRWASNTSRSERGGGPVRFSTAAEASRRQSSRET